MAMMPLALEDGVKACKVTMGSQGTAHVTISTHGYAESTETMVSQKKHNLQEVGGKQDL